MSLLRSARFPALVLLLAAAAGLAGANSPLAPALAAAKDTRLGVPGVLDLSLGQVIADGLLAVFFLVVAIELRHELTRGLLNSPRRALVPAIAAAGGVLVPIGLYLALTAGTPSAAGWPVPTATDIAFALGVLAVFGRGLPPAVRVFLLALAILDDLVGIVLIAVLFADGVDVGMLALAAVLVAVFAVVGGRPGARLGRLRPPLLVVVGVATWLAVHESGVHATIAGVALGLALAPEPAARARHALEPWVNGLVLPAFAFSAALVPLPTPTSAALEPAFWGVLVALPVGKLVGIVVFGALAQRLGGATAERMGAGDLAAAGALGGVGFTVSLLLADLSFADVPVLRDQATLGVLAGSLVSLLVAAMLVSWRAWHHRRTVPATV